MSIAAGRGFVDIVRTLLAAGANADLARSDGVAPLLLAAQIGNAEIAGTLLAAGAAVDRNGTAPLLLAVHGGNLPLVAQLLEHGAHTRPLMPDHLSALETAIRAGLTDIARLLVLNKVARGEWLPMEKALAAQFAKERGAKEIVRLLAEKAPASLRDRALLPMLNTSPGLLRQMRRH